MRLLTEISETALSDVGGIPMPFLLASFRPYAPASSARTPAASDHRVSQSARIWVELVSPDTALPYSPAPCILLVQPQGAAE